MVHKDMVFDMRYKQKRLGIAEANCPHHRLPSEHKETVTTPTVHELAPQKINNSVGKDWHSVYPFTFVFLAGLTFSGCLLYSRHQKRTGMPQMDLGVAKTSDLSSTRIRDASMGAPSFVIMGRDEYDNDDEEGCQFLEDYG